MPNGMGDNEYNISAQTNCHQLQPQGPGNLQSTKELTTNAFKSEKWGYLLDAKLTHVRHKAVFKLPMLKVILQATEW